jgi:hypothetical protein
MFEVRERGLDMAGFPQGLRASFTDHGMLEGSLAGRTRIGLAGLLAIRGHRARRVAVPGSAVEGFRWRLRDVWNTTWWPQGIAPGEHFGRPVVITSWFAQPKRGREMGSRISVVDLGDPRRLRYHHVLLVAPRREHGGIALDPVVVHAGGIAVSGDRLFVAATFGGIREFRLGDIMAAPPRGLLQRLLGRGSGPFGYRYLLPELASYGQEKKAAGERMRYSFLSLEAGGQGDEVRLVSGEYSKDDERRLARLRLADGRTEIDEVHVPGIPQMQGVAVHEGRWFVSASQGDKVGGDLWVGDPASLVRLPNVLPPGPEDLALWPERRQLWCVSEFPGKRWVFGLDLDGIS